MTRTAVYNHRRTFVIALDCGFVLALAFVKKIAKWMLLNFSRCIFAKYGILCPSCGGTRCVYEFASLNFKRAFGYNPLIFLFGIYLILLLALLNLEYIFNLDTAKSIFKKATKPYVFVVFAIGFAVFGIARNFI